MQSYTFHNLILVSFFFFKQKAAYEMRISDSSSDVCSSDLHGGPQGIAVAATTSALDFRQRPPGQTADIHGGRLDDSGVAIFIGGHIGRDRVGFAIIAVAFRHLQSCERSEEHTSEIQSLMRISYAVFCLNKKKKKTNNDTH